MADIIKNPRGIPSAPFVVILTIYYSTQMINLIFYI
jgi:hypothetical protein